MTPSGTTHFIHDLNGNVIAETAGNGPTGATGTVREYIYLPETEIAPAADGRTRVDRPLAVVNAVNTATPATYYVHVDHLNRPVMMTDSTKAQVWAAVWQAWGGSYSITGPQANDARFPGQWFQLESGLHYNWHRHYDPSIGRYTQPDPLGFVDGPSVYGYVGGEPQGIVDPDGESARRAAIAIAIAARQCIKDPNACRKDILCPGVNKAKDVICLAPGCNNSTHLQRSRVAKFGAQTLMRAAEACLVLRDAEEKFCPENHTSATKHKSAQTRIDQVNKIKKCQEICGADPWFEY